MNGSTLKLVFKTARPTSSLMSGLFVMMMLLREPRYSIIWSVLHAIPVILVTMIAFIVNDIYDYEKDLLSNYDRPILKGSLKKNSASLYAIVFAIIATILALLIKVNESFIVFAAALIGAVLYSPASRITPVLKGGLTAALCLAAVMYAGIIAGISIPLYLYPTIGFFIFGRELWLDTKHFEADSSFDLKTLPSYLGLKNSRIIAWILMTGSIFTFLLNQTNIYAAILSSLAVVCMGFAILFDFLNMVEHGGITTLAMLFTILAMLFTI